MTNKTQINLCDGKYTVIHSNGTDFHALRHGDRWRELTGDGFVLALVQEIESLQEEVASLKTQIADNPDMSLHTATWITEGNRYYQKDGACKACCPSGGLLIEGFTCIPHRAEAIVAAAKANSIK